MHSGGRLGQASVAILAQAWRGPRRAHARRAMVARWQHTAAARLPLGCRQRPRSRRRFGAAAVARLQVQQPATSLHTVCSRWRQVGTRLRQRACFGTSCHPRHLWRSRHAGLWEACPTGRHGSLAALPVSHANVGSPVFWDTAPSSSPSRICTSGPCCARSGHVGLGWDSSPPRRHPWCAWRSAALLMARSDHNEAAASWYKHWFAYLSSPVVAKVSAAKCRQ